MDYQEVVETLQDIHDVAESRIKNGDARGVIYIPRDKLDVLKTAISAIHEMSGYEDKLTEIYVEHDGMIETVVDELVEYGKAFGNRNPIKARLLTNGDVDLWECYKQLGTLEEVREAVEKQKTQEPRLMNGMYGIVY